MSPTALHIVDKLSDPVLIGSCFVSAYFALRRNIRSNVIFSIGVVSLVAMEICRPYFHWPETYYRPAEAAICLIMAISIFLSKPKFHGTNS